MNEEIKYEYKEVQVQVAFTEEGRKNNFEKLKLKMEKEGWELEKYFNGGLTKTSIATFKRDIQYKDKEVITPKKSIKKKIIWGIVLFILILILIPGSDEKQKENTKEESVPQEDGYYKKYESKTLGEIKEFKKGTLEKIAVSYAKNNEIDDYMKMYDCLAYYAYSKSEQLTVGEIAGWCKRDFENKREITYINKELLFEDFSKWDGSYIPLENAIKKSMNDEESYKHISTLYSFEQKDGKDYMVLTTTFSGKNVYGGVVKQVVKAKVDVKTKKMEYVE